MMLNHFFPDFFKAGPLGDQWNIPVHLTINFNTLNHFIPVCLEASIEIGGVDFKNLEVTQ